MGYHHSPPRAEPGEYEGKAYDVVQEERLYFEATLLDTDQTPRGGPRCRLLIDRTVDELPTQPTAETPGGATVTPEEMQAKIAALEAKLAESEAKIVAMSAENADMKMKMDAAEISAAAPEIEAVAADQGVAKGADAAATLDALTTHLKIAVKGKDSLPMIRVLAASAKARDAKPGRHTFETKPEPVKTGDAATADPDKEV
jgi:hypothetical protein